MDEKETKALKKQKKNDKILFIFSFRSSFKITSLKSYHYVILPYKNLIINKIIKRISYFLFFFLDTPKI